mgnify:FL=1
MFYILSSKFQSRHRDFNFYDHRKTDEETDNDTDVMPDLSLANILISNNELTSFFISVLISASTVVTLHLTLSSS